MSPTQRVRGWTAFVAVAAAGVTTAVFLDRPWMDPRRSWWLLPLFAVLVAAAERLRVRVRVGDEVEAVNLVEAILAPLLFVFPGPLVVVTVAAGLVISAVVHRGSLVKSTFNLAQWTLATACAALFVAPAVPQGLTPSSLGRLVGALAVVFAVNNTAFLVVLAFSRNRSPLRMPVDMWRLVVVASLGGWTLNLLFGLLYVVAYVGHPLSALLFAVPLVVLHLAFRGFAAVRADQQRLAGLHHAAQSLAAPVDPRDGVDEFLGSVSRCFDARAAALVLRVDDAREVHLYDRAAEPAYSVTLQPADAATAEGALAALPGPLHVQPRDHHPLAELLREHGWRDCLSAPMLDDGRLAGCLVVLDQDGVEGSAAGELAVLEALARETAGTFAKGRLLADVLDERRKLAEVIGATSDGMLSLTTDGSPASWNRALEQLTGITAEEAIGRVGAVLRLQPRTLDGIPIDVTRWSSYARMPGELRITAADGTRRRLSCSYSRIDDEDGTPRVLVVVARDVTSDEEMAVLRQEFERLAEEQAVARSVVEQLQQAVVPPAPPVEQSELAVEYLPSDEHAPTGGDLYDWQLLPDGDLHLAVVDVLGHGVSATKAALSVVHTLRVVASEGTPLEDIVGRADALLTAQDPDLVATAVVARYTPTSGRLRVVSGGHPPALVLHRDGSVTQVAATGGAIGWPGAGSDDVTELTLATGETLLLYTDGLVEARKNLLEGMDDLARYAGAVAALPTAELPAALVRRMLAGAERRDDTLALVLRRQAPALPTEFTRTIGPDAAAAAGVRRELGVWLTGHGRQADDATTVVSELLANAVRVARSAVSVTATLDGQELRLVVGDDGPGDADLDGRGLDLPAADALGGRGLFLVRSLCASVSPSSGPAGTVLTCLLRPEPLVPQGRTGWRVLEAS